MTVGRDVSSLFTDVVNCMQTENLELKKLVYLYLINYANSLPDLAILALNTFLKDSQDPNPLIRAWLFGLWDASVLIISQNISVISFRGAPRVGRRWGFFLESLKDLISDNNPMVVANAVAALAEIQQNGSRPIFEITSHTLSKLLTALNECTEWRQVFVLDSLSRYKAAEAREAENSEEKNTRRVVLNGADQIIGVPEISIVLAELHLVQVFLRRHGSKDLQNKIKHPFHKQ
ncbi:beta-adaptin-like protein B [Durio zibethinus]|uniref:Beta-adaptin-like protein B n=1 Tax=Durio zibethinus TaxID=66656 RepID=A0A6P5WXP3_DURZI|nr:beta-adaptin-like protein B [Durio zibethinus]